MAEGESAADRGRGVWGRESSDRTSDSDGDPDDLTQNISTNHHVVARHLAVIPGNSLTPMSLAMYFSNQQATEPALFLPASENYLTYWEHWQLLWSVTFRDGIEPSLYGFGSVRVLVKFVNVRF